MNTIGKGRRINIIRWDNNLGLSRDAEIIATTLKAAGFKVSIQPFWKPGRRYNLLNLMFRLTQNRPLYDINLFLEDILSSWLPLARINCLIPNQEWFRTEAHLYLPKVDWVLCKTKHAQHIFNQLNCHTKWISFTGCDRLNSSIPRQELSFLHLSSSPQKGTNTLIKVWQNHPEWPVLTLIQNPKYAQSVIADNINYKAEYMSDEQLHYYQNFHDVHLCPSESEGFGHSIIEAMSCQAVVLTTNAPPMNELITLERGILADYSQTSVQQLGVNYHVDAVALEQQVKRILEMSVTERRELGKNARMWYTANDQYFKHHFVEVIDRLYSESKLKE